MTQLTPEEITDSIYKAYGTDSGILFGIRERDVVKAIVEFTVNRLDVDTALKAERERAGKLMEWAQPRFRYNPTVNEWQDTRTLKIYTTPELIELFLNQWDEINKP